MPGGQPAATVGSVTAHGGTIVAGAPNVLIAGQPAARQGDMHVCPLCDPPGKPHVGGPIANGVPTVLIAGQPAATVSSMATCASPAPDMVAQGAPNVLISQGGSSVVEIGGSGGMVEIGSSGGMVEIGGQGAPAGGGAAAAQGAQASAAAAAAGSIEATERADHFARAQFVDASGRPMAGPRYAHSGAAGKETESFLRGVSEVRRAGMEEPGQQTAKLFGLGQAEWSKQEARVGEEVTISCRAFGYEDGEAAKVLVYRREGGRDVVEAEIEAEVSGGKVEVEWTYELPEVERYDPKGGEQPVRRQDGKPRREESTYIAKVHVHPDTAETGPLGFRGVIELSLSEADGSPAAREPYVVRFANGDVRKGQLDGQGKAKVEDAPPCRHEVSFPNHENVQRQPSGNSA